MDLSGGAFEVGEHSRLHDVCSFGGGLIDVDRDTIELKFFNYARLKFHGSKEGYILENIVWK